jgi:hypothetical protein
LLDSANHEFATFSGGNGTPLVITFTSAATPATTALVNEVAHALQYTNGSDAPPSSVDVSISLNDGDFTSGNQGAEPTPSFLDSIGSDVVTVNITPVNDPPVVDLNGAGAGTSTSISFTEGDPTTIIAPSATVVDPDAPADFAGGVLTVAFTANGTLDDQLVIIDDSGVGGHISTEDINVKYDGVVIGTFSGGTDGSTPLTITFNSDATPAIVQAIVDDIAYANGSNNPSGLDRTVTYTLTDGQGGTSNGATATIHVTPVDTLAVATDDIASTPENAPVTIHVLNNDFDPDGGPAAVISQINGAAIAVGGHVTLASGATVTLNADMTITYDPSGKFNYLTSTASGETGAVDTSADDSFTYTLSGGGTGTATVDVTVNGVVSSDDQLRGDAGDNVITGTPGPDFFMLQQGGSDTASGMGGNDAFYFGAALDPSDHVDGGAGQDVVAIQGNYAGFTLGAHNLDNVETLSLLTHSDNRFGGGTVGLDSYDITSVDANVAAGKQLTINASTLQAGENFTFNGSAEMDGSFFIYAGAGTDNLTGGANADAFFFAEGRYNAGDVVNGGGGNDIMVLRGDYSGANAVHFAANAMTSIETVTLMSASDTRFFSGGTRYSYDITTDDGNVAAGATMTFNAGGLHSDEILHFDGSAETNGNFRIFGGAGNDAIVGGHGNDLIYGGLGQDDLTGGAGADTFQYNSIAETTNAAPDHILDFTSGTDKIDLSRIDADTNVAGDQAFTFIGANAFDGHAGELRAVDSGLGYYNVQGDTNGDGIADFTIHVTLVTSGPTLHPIVGTDFIP